MKIIRIKNTNKNFDALMKEVNEKREPVKIISKNGELILIDVNTWGFTKRLLEEFDDLRLLDLAQSRKGSHSITFEDFIIMEDLDFDEIKKLAPKVEIE